MKRILLFFYQENTQKIFYFKDNSTNNIKMSSKNNLEDEVEKKNFLSILAGQSAFVEEFVFAAGDQTWMTFSAEEETVGISGNGESWEGPEAGGWRMWIDLRRAFEADDGFWVAFLQHKVGPVAAVNSLVVN